MKKLIIFALVLAFWHAFTAIAYAQTKTDDELLQETVELSKQVKEFGKTLGIEPTEALSKSSGDQKPFSLLAIHIQKRGSISLSDFERAALGFEIDSERMPIAEYYLYSTHYSIFIRQVNEFAGEKTSVITPSFAKRDLFWKVMVISHEDLHGGIHADSLSGLNNTVETLVTPLGFIAALKFFEYKNDLENIQKTKYYIEYFRALSVELNSLEKKMKELSEKVNPILFCTEFYEKEILSEYLKYSARLAETLKPYGQCEANEAAITSDLMYWKYFDQVINLYKKSGDLKTLIEDMKVAPGKQGELEKYLDDLDQKYSAATEK